MSFNVFDDQINTRREHDTAMLEEAFASLTSIFDQGPGKLATSKEVKGAIAEILSLLGAQVADVPENVTDLDAQLNYMLRPSGVMRRRVELVGDWWKDATGPFLGSTKSGELVVIKQGKFSGYEYHAASGKPVKVNLKTSLNINVDAFCFYRPLPAKKLTLMDLGLFMMKIINLSDVVFVLGISLLASLMGMVMPFMNKQIFESVIPSGIVANVLPVATLLLGAAFASTIFGISRSLIMSRFMDRINLSVQSAAMMRVFSLPVPFFKKYSSGELSSRTMSINTLCQMLSNTVLTTGLSALFSFVYLFQMSSFAPTLLIPGLISIGATFIFMIVSALFQLKLSRQQMKAEAKMSGLVYALFTGVQKIKLAGAEKRVFAKWATAYSELSRLSYTPPIFLRINPALSVLITMAGSLLIYTLAGASKVSQADYMAFNAAFGMVSGSILGLAGVAISIVNIKPLMEMVQPIIETIPESVGSKKILTSLSGNMEINNLKFRYGKDQPLILDNISLKIRSGEYVAIVGKTGCGKSTLLRLLLGFEKSETGAIYYDGNDLDSLDSVSVRQKIGVVMQDGKLFSGDIFSNIIITAPSKTLDDAWEAAKLAGIDEEIRAMPMGMNTVISEGGGGISGGQRQRLLIARAIVSHPKILFFDEATSALDNITQRHVANSIDRLKCTRIVIAHRLSTIRQCSRIIVLDAGKIVEDGDYEKLMAKKGLFYDMVVRQTI